MIRVKMTYLGLVGKQKLKLGFIVGILSDSLDDLVDRCDPGSASDHDHAGEFLRLDGIASSFFQ
jgi:hypothetical protein